MCENKQVIRLAAASDRVVTLVGADIPGLELARLRELFDAAVSDGQCLVHVDSSGVVDGCIVTSPKSFFGRDFVRLLSVSSSHRRSGIGSALLAASVLQATTDTVFTSTNESNGAMRALLGRDGWAYSGQLTGLDDGDPELVFWREKKFTG